MVNEQVTTLTLTGATPETVEFSSAYPFYWICNMSESEVYAAIGRTPEADTDGTYTVAAGEKLRISGGVSSSSLTLIGNGKVQVIASGIATPPFVSDKKGGDISYVTDGLINLFEWNGSIFDSVTGNTFETREQSPNFVYDDKLKRAVGYFNNTAVYASVKTIKPLNNKFSLQCLMKTTSICKQVAICIGASETLSGGSVAIGCDENGYAADIISDGSGNLRFISTEKIVTDGNWHMITVTRDANKISIYVDGVIAIIETGIAANLVDQTFCGLGIIAGAAIKAVDTYLFDFCIWDKVLSASKVMQNWRYDKQRYNL